MILTENNQTWLQICGEEAHHLLPHLVPVTSSFRGCRTSSDVQWGWCEGTTVRESGSVRVWSSTRHKGEFSSAPNWGAPRKPLAPAAPGPLGVPHRHWPSPPLSGPGPPGVRTADPSGWQTDASPGGPRPARVNRAEWSVQGANKKLIFTGILWNQRITAAGDQSWINPAKFTDDTWRILTTQPQTRCESRLTVLLKFQIKFIWIFKRIFD